MIQLGTDRRSLKPEVSFPEKNPKTKADRSETEFSAFFRKSTAKNLDNDSVQEESVECKRKEPILAEENDVDNSEQGVRNPAAFISWQALQEVIIQQALAPDLNGNVPELMPMPDMDPVMLEEQGVHIQHLEQQQGEQQILISSEAGGRRAVRVPEEMQLMESASQEAGEIELSEKSSTREKPIEAVEIPVRAGTESTDSSSFQMKDDREPETGTVQPEVRAYGNELQAPVFRSPFSEQPSEHVARIHTTRHTIGTDMAEALISRMPLKEGVLELELEPASLGRLTIRVAVESGRTAVTVMSSNAETLEILSRNAVQIAHILEERTGQQVVVYTPQASESGDESAFEQQRHHQQQNQKERRNEPEESFAQQLRLGLI